MNVSFSLKHLASKSNGHAPVQWMLAQDSTSRAFYLVFRGSSDAQDGMVDICTIPNFDTSHGVGVHSGWASHKEKDEPEGGISGTYIGRAD